MNYNELKELIRHLKKIVPCGTCEKKFTNDAIHVISSYKDEALFHFNCPHCSNQLLVHVSITDQGSEKSTLNIQATNTDSISENDVLDIHNFLNGFKGDFKKLFSIEKH